jgi:hypothetical protein
MLFWILFTLRLTLEILDSSSNELPSFLKARDLLTGGIRVVINVSRNVCTSGVIVKRQKVIALCLTSDRFQKEIFKSAKPLDRVRLLWLTYELIDLCSMPRYCCLCCRVQTGCGAYPTSYPVALGLRRLRISGVYSTPFPYHVMVWSLIKDRHSFNFIDFIDLRYSQNIKLHQKRMLYVVTWRKT